MKVQILRCRLSYSLMIIVSIIANKLAENIRDLKFSIWKENFPITLILQLKHCFYFTQKLLYEELENL